MTQDTGAENVFSVKGPIAKLLGLEGHTDYVNFVIYGSTHTLDNIRRTSMAVFQ